MNFFLVITLHLCIGANLLELSAAGWITTTNNPVTSNPTTQPSAGIDDLNKEAKILLDKYRDFHNAGPLDFDPALQKQAQSCANKQTTLDAAATDFVECKASGDYIWKSDAGSPVPPPAVLAYSVMSKWYGEIKDVVFDDLQYNAATDHVTQILWKKSTKFGCAQSKVSKTVFYVSCVFSPTGNQETVKGAAAGPTVNLNANVEKGKTPVFKA